MREDTNTRAHESMGDGTTDDGSTRGQRKDKRRRKKHARQPFASLPSCPSQLRHPIASPPCHLAIPIDPILARKMASPKWIARDVKNNEGRPDIVDEQ